jgi:hypothetical protein
LSTYAVVDSPELPQQPPEPLANESEAPAPIAEETLAEPVEETPVTPPEEVGPAYYKKKLSTKTQIVPNMDELEPL